MRLVNILFLLLFFIPLVDGIATINFLEVNSSSGFNTTRDNLTGFFEVEDNDTETVFNISDWRLEGVSDANLNIPCEKNPDIEAKDYSTYFNNGSLEGDAFINTTNIFIGSTCEFDGDGDYIEVADDDSLDLSTKATWSLWVKRAQYTDLGGAFE